MAREFMDGTASVNLTFGSVVLEELTYTLPKHIVPDGSLSEWGGNLLKVTHAATTSSGDIVDVGARFDDANLYIVLRFKEPHDDPFGIFIDLDPAPMTGTASWGSVLTSTLRRTRQLVRLLVSTTLATVMSGYGVRRSS